MIQITQPPEMDLFMPTPSKGQSCHPCSILTHYFGFSIPEHEIGAFIYARCQPAFPLAQGGLCVFQGTDNLEPLDMAYIDYRLTMPWPVIDGNTIQFDSGLRFEFLEPGKRIRITYKSPDGGTRLDIIQQAVSPMYARGHVVPGEELQTGSAVEPGGMEQQMHVTGELILDGQRLDIDCFNSRDRSWGQIRDEAKRSVVAPPVGWTPMHFGDDLTFCQVGFENLDTNPPWAELYNYPDNAPTTHFAWVKVGDEKRQVVSVRRNVESYHPRLYAAMKQTVEAVDEHGDRYAFSGRAIAMADMPAWPNAALRVGVYEWTDEQGRKAYDSYQEMWLDDAPHRKFREVLG